MIRLQKFIANAGLTSRRKAEGLILQGRVHVNGTPVAKLGTRVHPFKDLVTLDGRSIDPRFVQKTYIILNKPRGCVTTLSDPLGRQTVRDLIYDCSERIFPVGRLDVLSEGLLILTNDGELAHQMLHPSSHITKVYEVKVVGTVNQRILRALRNGIQTGHTFLRPKSVRAIKQLSNKTWLEFRLTDGRNRAIRKICETVGVSVEKLRRVAIGGLAVKGLGVGSYRYTTKKSLLCEIGRGEIEREYWSEKKTVHLKSKRKRKKA